MTAKAEFTISGDTKDAVRALDKLHKQQIRLRDENEKLKAANKSQAQVARDGLRQQTEEAKRAAEAYKAIGLAFGAISAAAIKAGTDVANFRNRLGNQQIAADQSVRQLAKQAQVDIPSARQLLARSVETGSRFAVPAKTSEAAIRELISQGAQNPELALRFLLPALQASNTAGDDPRESIRAITGLIAGAGEEKTPGNIRSVARTAALAFAGKPLQFGDLAALGKNASKAKAAGVSLPEQIAAFVTLQESGLPTDLAGSGVGQAALKLAAIGDKKPQVEALAALGLTPRDVNPLAQGGLSPAIGRLAGGLESIPAEQRAALLSRIVGEEGITPVSTLIQQRGLLQSNLELGGDAALFDQQVRRGSQGLAAAQIRLENEQRLTEVRSGQSEGFRNLAFQQRIQQLRQGGAVDQALAEQFADNPAALRAAESLFGGEDSAFGDARRRVSELSGNDPEVVKILQDMRDELKKSNQQRPVVEELERAKPSSLGVVPTNFSARPF